MYRGEFQHVIKPMMSADSMFFQQFDEGWRRREGIANKKRREESSATKKIDDKKSEDANKETVDDSDTREVANKETVDDANKEDANKETVDDTKSKDIWLMPHHTAGSVLLSSPFQRTPDVPAAILAKYDIMWRFILHTANRGSKEGRLNLRRMKSGLWKDLKIGGTSFGSATEPPIPRAGMFL
jgi:hypothetical protein